MGLVVVSASPLSSRLPAPFSTRRVAPNRRLRPRGIFFRRFDSISRRRFSTNVDIDVSQVVTEDEDTEDPSHSSGRPVLCLQSDVLGTKSRKFLEENYVDDLLTKFPVLSEEEQEALASTPAHPSGLYALYATFLAGNLVEQFWNFAWPAAVAQIHPSLLPVATVSFFMKLAIFIGGPLVGNLMDSFPRIPAYNYLTLVQTAAQLISASMIIYALSTVRPASAPLVLLQPWFIILVAAAATERLTGLALGVMMERDWVVQLAGPKGAIALAQANATLSRVDLFSEIAGASLFGILLTKNSPVQCLKLAAGVMICSLPVLILLGQLTNKLSNGILDRPKLSPCFREFIRSDPIQNTQNIESGLHTIRRGWREYMLQPVLPASIAYVMLYFNIALAPGAMMTAFLTNQGISPAIIGGFSGFCAFMGVAATFISASLVKKLGILKAGAAGLIFQASLLTTAVAVLWTGLISQRTPLFIFLFLIILSRLGHMSYDVVGTQILQTGIPADKANLIGATEISMASLAEFMMLGVAIVANDVAHFRFLAILSVCSVAGAALMFCRWLSHPSEHRKFSHYPHYQSG